MSTTPYIPFTSIGRIPIY
uniref:Uncharacterized protein n=1 Tax=Anguilla anguilla TaxID=7936 RepID=A0A0E9TP61_ANGAN